MKMQSDLERILDACIAEMRRGASLADCLNKYSQHAAQLRPLLELAEAIEDAPRTELEPGKILEALAEVSQKMVPRRQKRMRPFTNMLLGKPRLAWAFGSILVLSFILLGMTRVAADSTPGDFLYPLKLSTEKVRFLLSFTSEKKAELRLTFSDERLAELQESIQEGATFNPELLKAMLEEAKLALEESEIPEYKAPAFLARIDHFNGYQTAVLEQIRPQVRLKDREIVDEAIQTCRHRRAWVRQLMDEMEGARSDSGSHWQRCPPARKGETQKSKKWRWGPGCDWMR